MKNRLARSRPHIQHRAVAIFNRPLPCNLSRHQVTTPDQLRVFRHGFLQARNMFLRDDQDVGRALRVQIFKGKNMFVFIDFLGGHFAANDPAEQTIRHQLSLPSLGITITSRVNTELDSLYLGKKQYHSSKQHFVKKSIFNRDAPETLTPPQSPCRGPERLRAGGRRPILVPAPTRPPRDSKTSRLWPPGNASAGVPRIQRPLSARGTSRSEPSSVYPFRGVQALAVLAAELSQSRAR